MILAIDSGVSGNGPRPLHTEYSDCWCSVIADDPEEAMMFIKHFLESVRGDRMALMRTEPQVKLDIDFEAGKTIFAGTVRFARCNNVIGDTIRSTRNPAEVSYLGLPDTTQGD